MDSEDVRIKAAIVREQFEQKWGAWRRFISANPLTGTWIMFGVGLVIGTGAGREVIGIIVSLISLVI